MESAIFLSPGEILLLRTSKGGLHFFVGPSIAGADYNTDHASVAAPAFYVVRLGEHRVGKLSGREKA